jgi:HEAT repeat protein
MRLRGTAIAQLGRDTSAATAAYLRSLYGRLDSARLKEYVVAAMMRGGSAENVRWLASVARNPNEPMRVRRAALNAYARQDVPVADLARLYDATTERELREELVSVFGRRKEPEATDKLLAIARGDADPRLRRTAIASLARKDDPRTAKLLLEIIDRKP